MAARPAYPAPVDHSPPDDLFRRLPSRPTYEDAERAFARLRDRLSPFGYSPSTRSNWRCGVHRRGGLIWVEDHRQPPSTHC